MTFISMKSEKKLLNAGIPRAFGTLSQLFMLWFAGNYIGKEAVTLLASTISTFYLCSYFIAFGLPNFILRASTSSNDFSMLISTCFFVICIISLPLYLFLLHYLYLPGVLVDGYMVLLVVFGSIFLGLNRCLFELLKRRHLVSQAVYFEFVIPNMFLIALMVYLSQGKGSIEMIVGAVVIGYIFAFFMSLYALKSYFSSFSFSFYSGIKFFWRRKKETIYFGFSSLGSIMLGHLPIIIASIFLSISDAALFAIIQRLIGFTLTISGIVVASNTGKLADMISERKNIYKPLIEMTKQNFTLNFIYLLIISLTFQWIIPGFGDFFITNSQYWVIIAVLFIRLLRAGFGAPELVLTLWGLSHIDVLVVYILLAIGITSFLFVNITFEYIIILFALIALFRSAVTGSFVFYSVRKNA